MKGTFYNFFLFGDDCSTILQFLDIQVDFKNLIPEVDMVFAAFVQSALELNYF